MAEEFTAPATESEFEEIEGPPTESEFDETTGPATESEVPVVNTTVESVEDVVEESHEDLSAYIQGDGTFVGPTPKGSELMVATLQDAEKVYHSLDTCRTIDEICSATGLKREIVVECVQSLMNKFKLLSQDDTRFCNIGALGKMQNQFDTICKVCANR